MKVCYLTLSDEFTRCWISLSAPDEDISIENLPTLEYFCQLISKFAIFLFLLGFFNPPERMTASTTDFLVDNQLALILKVWPVCYCGNCSYHSVFLKCLMNSIVLECRSQVTVVLLWRSVVSCIGFFSHTSVVELTSPPSECREEATV